MARKFKVVADELSVPRSLGKNHDLYGNEIGYSHINKTWLKGEVLDEKDVSPVVIESIDNGEIDTIVEAGKDDESVVSEPIPGYDSLTSDEVRTLFKTLPSASVSAIKDYEANNGENRVEIAEYNIGLGESPVDRLLGNVGSDKQDAAPKDTANITTREVSEDDVRFGEGYTGDGNPDREFGSTESDEGEVAKAKSKPKRASRSKKDEDSKDKKDESK